MKIDYYSIFDSCISKKYFRLGGMALSECTRCVRAVKNTPVVNYTTPGLKTTRRIAYRPPIAVSPVLVALSVSYFKRTLWCWGQLSPYIGMGSLSTHMHLDCNAMRDVAKISPRVPSTCAQNAILSLLIIHIIPSSQSFVAIENPLLVPSVSCRTTSCDL
jgi:hypothetical protein